MIEEITLITDILNKNGSLIIIDAIMHTYDVNTNAIFIMIIWFKTFKDFDKHYKEHPYWDAL
jgi:hypothetical protein